MQIAEQIKKLRLAQGTSQETLAQHIGVSPQAVSRWETGATAPDISLLPSLAYYFQVSIDTLVGYDPKLTEAALDDIFHTYFSLLPSDPSAAKDLLETALSRFPGNEHLELLRLYHLRGADSLDERIELCKRLSASRTPPCAMRPCAPWPPPISAAMSKRPSGMSFPSFRNARKPSYLFPPGSSLEENPWTPPSAKNKAACPFFWICCKSFLTDTWN